MEKSKTPQKGAAKQQQQQQRPGTEQVRSGAHIQKETEKIQQPKQQQKVKK